MGLFSSEEPPSPPPPEEAPERLLGKEIAGAHRYRILTIVAHGGWSTVYRAERVVRHRAVAIKVVSSQITAVEEMRARFDREVAIAKRLKHEHLVDVSDSGELPDGARFMVMELLEGETLDSLLSKGPLALPRAIVIVEQILSALAEAHRNNVVHRDVKPSNIFVEARRTGGDHAKLFDFGIALNEKAALKLTMPGTAFGTPGYISPEMARGDKSDGRADLYSLGVTLFEMAVGRLPFVDHDPIELLKAHLMRTPPTPRSLNPAVPEALEAIIVKAMAKSAADRFPDANAMREALATFRRTLTPTTPRRRRWFLW